VILDWRFMISRQVRVRITNHESQIKNPLVCDPERFIVSARREHFSIDVLHTRPGRPGTDRTFHTRHRVGIAFDVGFDPSIGQVTYVARYTFACGGVLHVIAEADALHASADEKLTGDAHGQDEDYTCEALTARPFASPPLNR